MPFGTVTATYRIGTEVHQATSTGYHDHNWMNKQMVHLIDHWWWAKGQVGPFTFVTAHLVAAKKYGYTPLDWFMLARDGKVVADDGTKVAFGKSGRRTDEHTGKPIPDEMSFDYRDGDTRYLLTYARQKTLVSQKVTDYTSGLQKLVAEVIRYPLGYLRFSALVSLDRYQGGELVEHQEGPAVFEQIAFAHHMHDEQRGRPGRLPQPQTATRQREQGRLPWPSLMARTGTGSGEDQTARAKGRRDDGR